MPDTYITIQGDTWDTVAKRVFDDERAADAIMSVNLEYLSLSIFPAGLVLKLPDYVKPSTKFLPPWRR